MNLIALFADKSLKPNDRTETISTWLSSQKNGWNELLTFAKSAKDPIKAACIGAIESVTKTKPELCTADWFDFVAAALHEKSPAIKREAARVVGNVAALFPKQVESALPGLLNNSEDDGTVVRWSAAYALGEIVKMKTPLNKDLVPVIEAICEREEKSSIQKIYTSAIKKVSRP